MKQNLQNFSFNTASDSVLSFGNSNSRPNSKFPAPSNLKGDISKSQS